jgi:hypothetical protein
MFSLCEVYCPICRSPFDWMHSYGAQRRCCGKECHEEFEWRRALAIMGKPYRPRPAKADIETADRLERREDGTR